MSKPAARLNDMHVCPMQTPAVVPIPHVGGPIIAMGEPRVLIGGQPAACVGDLCVCVGPPDVIVMGSFTVLMGGRPAARMGDMTAHGGTIMQGLPTVLIGDAGGGAGSPAAFTMGAARAGGAAFTRTTCTSEGALKFAERSRSLVTADPQKKSWIEIELVDQKGRPVPYERYRVVPPGGAPMEGFLDDKGLARVDGIDPGTCTISFPDLDAASWKPEQGPPARPAKPVPPVVLRKPKIARSSVTVRFVGRPGIRPESVRLLVRAPAAADRPLVQLGSVVLRPRGRPGVQRETVALVPRRPSVEPNSVRIATHPRPGIHADRVVITARVRPRVNLDTVVLTPKGPTGGGP